ncbi:hypothetical protein [Bacillus solimangrovi]|uniref:Uncharacterized protein n=1 Tax=Bacillus solimangrovi TaxID=1305675 RepID=A0A1E5LJ79_9BACI|nr:hypothetical protein [Bacillus solimangrovi]OEH94096.1 hypothetical protein BFG57_09625 [Bacillus solimangrovi]
MDKSFNDICYYFKTVFTYNEKEYSSDELVDLFYLFVQETKDEEWISESLFGTESSMVTNNIKVKVLVTEKEVLSIFVIHLEPTYLWALN